MSKKELSDIDKELLNEVSNIDDLFEGTFNIRRNGKLFEKNDSEDIRIVAKTDAEGIDIIVKEGIVGEVVNIPVIITESGLNDLVYNDFYIGDNADIVIKAGCAIHNDHGHQTEHSGIHRFHLGINSKVKYIEKHYGCGAGEGNNILNPVTEVYLKDGSKLEMETTQISGVDKAVRKTLGSLGKNSTLVIRENILTDNEQYAETIFDVTLDEDDASCHLISRAVAKDNSTQKFVSNLVGNAKSYAHSECDAIIDGNAKVSADPKVSANHPETTLIHEATIGKIAGEQLTKLRTLGLTEEEATSVIINGFLR